MNIEDIDKKIKELNKLKKLLNTPVLDFETPEETIFKKYLEVESVVKVAKYVNELGYRINNRKYISNDISSIITNKDIVIKNKDLKQIVNKIFKANKKGKRVFY